MRKSFTSRLQCVPPARECSISQTAAHTALTCISAAARTGNTAIYATSNRRHLVKESFSDRNGDDDVHRNDTLQETLSLSARFGLRVNFSRPDKKAYVTIATELARSKGITLSDDELALKAEQFAISSGNGRSARTAKQFVAGLSQLDSSFE